MENTELKHILIAYKSNNIGLQQAYDEILSLFSVGQSEQLKCFIAEEFAECQNSKKNSECISCKHY